MDTRVQEIEQLIRQTNDRQMAQRIKIQQSRIDHELIVSRLRQLVEQRLSTEEQPDKKETTEKKPKGKSQTNIQPEQKPQVKTRSEGKEQVKTQPVAAPEVVVSKRIQPTTDTAKMLCGKCGTELKPGVKFCKHCGTRVELQAHAVPQPEAAKLCVCGANIVPGAKFCRKCGKPIHLE